MTVTKHTIKDLLIIFAIEIITVPIIVAYFKFIEPKKVAATIAAITFVLTGLAILKITRRWPDAYASFVYWAIHIHIFVFSIPMLVARAVFWEKNFEDIRFLVFTGPQFHSFSEKAYMVLMIGTIIDIVVHAVKKKRLEQKKDAVEKKI